MSLTLDDIQARIAAIVDQDEDTANISTTDYSLRTSFINRALHEWGEIGQWQTLLKEYNSIVSTSTNNASIALPADFRKLASYPLIANPGRNDYPEVLPQEDNLRELDNRVWILGNPQSGYVMRAFGYALGSGASVQVPYYAMPTSLSTTTSVPEIPNPEYLVQKTVAYLWEGREDPRFPQAKADADRILNNMIERENTSNYASSWSEVHTVEERDGFRWGRD